MNAVVLDEDDATGINCVSMGDLRGDGSVEPTAAAASAAAITTQGVREAVSRAERDRLARIAYVVALAYIPVAGSHLLLLPKAGQPPMIAVALGCTAVLYLSARRLAGARDDPWRHTWVTAVLYTCIIGHSVVRLLYAREPNDTMFVGVLAVAMALVPGSMLMHSVAVGSYLTGWSVIMVVMEGYATFSPYLGALVLTACLSLTIRYLEHSQRNRVLELQLRNARRRERLAESEAERRHALDSLAHEARHDSLTGMPNRSSFTELLERALKRARRGEDAFAVLSLDVDRFKLVNESLGHEVGDRLLQVVSERLLRFVRPGDAVARFGGDEFAILLVNLRSASDALLVAERLHTVFEEPFRLADYEVPLSVSIGVAPYRTDYQDAGDMLRDADIAMHAAKEAEDSLRVFDGDMHTRAVTRLQTELDLRRALSEDQLELHYQPLVRFEDEAILGFEALVRWQHPTRGLLPPADFLPLAEESGLIVDIDRWVLTRACRDLGRLRRQRPSLSTFVSVNISARTFAQPDFEELLQAEIERRGVEPERLWLEIVESTLIDQAAMAEERIARLREMGVTMALDDFGVGYSSLGYLQRFAYNVMKIDRSFVQPSKRNMHLLEAMVQIARGLEMTVVAEGIEERAQFERLRELGMEIAQGYLFAKPMPAEEALALLDQEDQPSADMH